MQGNVCLKSKHGTDENSAKSDNRKGLDPNEIEMVEEQTEPPVNSPQSNEWVPNKNRKFTCEGKGWYSKIKHTNLL